MNSSVYKWLRKQDLIIIFDRSFGHQEEKLFSLELCVPYECLLKIESQVCRTTHKGQDDSR